MASAWTLAVARDNLSRTELTETDLPTVGAGEALLRVDRIGLTANNVTYALLGESFHYWDFFPTRPGWGMVPLWGFAEVRDSTVDGVRPGDRVFGYLPPASHLLLRPGRVDAHGFRDASPHRAALPSPYNAYALTTADPAYERDREDLQILYRPLFFTSFLLTDSVADHAYHDADVLVLSSASSKTAYGTAFLLQGGGPAVVGLTSAANVAFTESLGCYDTVLPYAAIDRLSADRTTVHLDFAGNAEISARLRGHLGQRLRRDVIVGVTHQELTAIDATVTVFFAPDQMRKRLGDWGRDGLDQRFAQAWRRFAPSVEHWVDVVVSTGPEALREVWLEVLAGRTPPRVGHVVAL